MKTTQNVALVAVPMIRAAVSDIETSIVNGELLLTRRECFRDATSALKEIANQLEQYAGATGTSHTDDTAPSAAIV